MTNVKSGGVNGYPMIFYGGDPYGDRVDGQPPQFPAQLSSMSSLIADAAYQFSGTAPGDLDISYDEWLIPSTSYTGGIPGALEVMVAPYFNFAYGPAGSFVRTFTATVTVNGAQSSVNFDEYKTGNGAGNFVLFFPSNGGWQSGEVRLNLLDFLNEGATTAGLNSNWYLAGIEFGSEFGDASTPNYSVNVTKLDIEQTMK